MPTRQRWILLLLFAFAAVLIGACSQGSVPSKPAGVPVSVFLTGYDGRAPLIVGRSVAFGAQESLSDLHVRTCPSAAWQSSNAAVAKVGSDGVATALSAGSATISATCDGLTAHLLLNVFEASTLRGTVTDDGAGAPVAGAYVALAYTSRGPFPSVVTDGDGHYRIADIARGLEFEMSASKTGFDAVSTFAKVLQPEAIQDLKMRKAAGTR